MAFTSLHFALFFAVICCGLLLIKRNDAKILWLLAGGIFFYGYWDWRFLALIGFTSVFDFFLGLQIGAAEGIRKKRLLQLDICVNLGILAFFKYFNFFIDSADALLTPLGVHIHTLNIILPIGISFFVFEAMSYCIDIYRGHLKPYTDWRHFALFIFFFPRMIAGPIIRPADFLPQLQRPIVLTGPNFYIGAQMFLLGLTKKVVVADNLAGFVDVVFAHPERFSNWAVLQAVIAYSIQIFCDFSGYSDMALGTAKILGFDLPVNFRMPYVSLNVTEFWRRWHISLSSWLRDYLYIPLGGNRKGITRTYLNLMITMALGGLWHGASWNFVIWGILHGLGLSVHKLYSHWRQTALPAPARAITDSLPMRAVSWLLTYAFVCFGWIFFRAQHFETAALCLQKLAGAVGGGMAWLSGPFLVAVPCVVAAHLLGLWIEKNDVKISFSPHRFTHWLAFFSWAFGVFFLCATQAAPFIYFQF